MGDLYYRNMLTQVWKNKRWIAICVAVCMVLSGFAGYRKGLSVKQEVNSYKQALEEFENSMAGYDEAIAAAQAAADEARQQAEDQQKYCDESVLMQIDAQKEWVATFQRQIISMDGGVQNNVVAALIAYVNTGGFREKLFEKTEEMVQSAYLAELVSCTNQSNVITVKIIYKDEDSARRIIEYASQIFDAQAAVFQTSIGTFTLQKYDTTVYDTVDISTMNTQTNAKNILKSLQTSVTDTQNKVISAQTAKDNYEQNNYPEEVVVKRRRVVMMQYLFMGMLIGFIVAIVSMMIRYMTGLHLHYKEELEHAGWEVIGCFDHTKGYTENFDRSILQLTYLKNKRDSHATVLCYSGKNDELLMCVQKYKAALEEKGVVVNVVDFLDQTAETMNILLQCDSSVFFAAAGYTKYTDAEQYKAFCEKFEIEMWGCVFVG